MFHCNFLQRIRHFKRFIAGIAAVYAFFWFKCLYYYTVLLVVVSLFDCKSKRFIVLPEGFRTHELSFRVFQIKFR